MMNLSKNLYVFMLALLIVASGCLGSGTTDADEEVESTVNNYYWNNTTQVITELPEMIALGGFVNGGSGVHNITATINTTAGQMIQIIEAATACVDDNQCYILWESNCSEGASFGPIYLPIWLQDGIVADGKMPGSALNCTHTVDVFDPETNQYTNQGISWSLVYSIVPVTVG